MVVYLLVDGYIYFGGSGPEYNYALAVVGGLEVTDVFAELFYEFPACAGLHVVAVETLGIVVVESGRHGFDSLELFAHGVDVLFFEDFSVDSSLVGVCSIYVPCAENDIVEVCERNYLVVFEVFFVSTLSDADSVVLSHRADGLGKTFTCHKHTGHESSSDCTAANNQDAELAGCRT